MVLWQLETCAWSHEDPLAWWRANHTRYPVLRHLAFTHFAAPASTAICDRLFSCAGNVVNEARPRTQAELAEGTHCLRNWSSLGIW
jgi:hypothetical protein